MLRRFVATTFSCLPFALVFVTGCTLPKPLSPQEVENLTTCATGDLDVIKKNLLLAGWSIEREDADALQTDFKPIDGYRGVSYASNSSERIAVVRLNDHASRFVVRQRAEGYETVTTGERKDSRGRTVSTSSQVVDTKSESEEAYYDTDRARYLERRQKICGAY